MELPGQERKVADVVLDIRGLTCPMTFVRTRLALDRMAPGAVLEVMLQGDEPRESVPRMAAMLGHAVRAVTPAGDGSVIVVIEKR